MAKAVKPAVKKVAAKATTASKVKAKPEAVGNRTDYEAMERDYRTGTFTDQELATKYGKSRQAITKMAKAKSWKKDLSLAVRQATRASLIADEATKKVALQVAKGGLATTDTVLAAAEMNKQVILGHRDDIRRTKNLTAAMLAELQETTTGRDRLANVLEIVAKDADATATQISEARQALAEITRLPVRVLAATRLVQAMGRLQQLERTAFGLDEPEQPPPIDEAADLSDEELDARIAERYERLNSRRTG